MKRILITISDSAYEGIEYNSNKNNKSVKEYMKEIIEVMYKKKERKIAL